MKILFEVILWISIAGILHTYLFYPILVWILGRNKPLNPLRYILDAEMPQVSILMAVYNEEKVIEEKIRCLQNLDYPAQKLSIFIGSDNSSDQTNALLEKAAETVGQLYFFPYAERQGKPGVINNLAREATRRYPAGKNHVFLITDANVMPAAATLRTLVRHFKNEKIAIVDAHMVHTGLQTEGISKPEDRYISSEVLVKNLEGRLWGKMIGPFGGCYALRSDYFTEVPATFLVDDFYIAMQVFLKGGDAINDLDAMCFEAVSHDWREEYRRKARISTGNFQNLLSFPGLWWPPFSTLNFAFFSHKVLRWIGPFLLIAIFLSAALLALLGNLFYYRLFFILSIVFLIVPILDYLADRVNINFLPFRGIRYFLLMNLALMEGFFQYFKGVKSNVWEPPKRN